MVDEAKVAAAGQVPEEQRATKQPTVAAEPGPRPKPAQAGAASSEVLSLRWEAAEARRRLQEALQQLEDQDGEWHDVMVAQRGQLQKLREQVCGGELSVDL